MLSSSPSSSRTSRVEEQIGGSPLSSTTDNKDSSAVTACSKNLTRFSNIIRRPIQNCVMAITQNAAMHPYLYIVGLLHLSVLLAAFGLLTNFRMEVDPVSLYGVIGTDVAEHRQWVNNESGFGDYNARPLTMIVHANGDNVVSDSGIHRCFEALKVVTLVDGYVELCSQSKYVDANGETTCSVRGVTSFWNGQLFQYKKQVDSDDAARAAISNTVFPDGASVNLDEIMGNYKVDNGAVNFAESFIITIPLPAINDAIAFEGKALGDLLQLREEWDSEEGNPFRLEVYAERSLDDESTRSILEDMPLIPLVFVVMSVFTCFVFFRKDKVKSQSVLGFGAVVSILLAVLSGYGLLFTLGVPYNNLVAILPFVMFGIGLDDVFIISSAFSRTDNRKDPVERIRETFEEAGPSITMTTLSTVLAFGLGCLSKIPSMRWLSLYAFPSVLLVFFYQLTFFVAVCVLDAKRIKSNRMDCCFCVQVEEDPEGGLRKVGQDQVTSNQSGSKTAMTRYAAILFRPWAKGLVLVAFTALSVVSAISATKIGNEFKLSEVVPEDSYTTQFFETAEAYTSRGNAMPIVYFRGVDQSDEHVQEQMENFINELVSMKQIEQQPAFFWLRDFKKFVNSTIVLQDLPFPQQLAVFLRNPIYQRTYGSSIVLDEKGNIESSRCVLSMTKLDLDNTEDQIEALHDQRKITALQPVNQGSPKAKFFTYDEKNYYIWEFYYMASHELIVTTMTGIVAVTALGFIFVPHWTAPLYIFPIITVLCIDLLGLLRFCGVSINAVSYMAVMMSIGLLVDFIMHILLRYLESDRESRESKARDALESMGSSLLLGGLSTFLGIMPLAFSTSKLLSTVFTAFALMIGLGLSHGLIFLPVLLSLIGTTDCIRLEHHDDLPKSELQECASAESHNWALETIETTESSNLSLP